MVDTLVITEDVQVLASSLRTVRSAFDGAQRTADGIAGAVGHPRLADVLHDFAGKWDDRRRELAEQVDTLAELAATVDDNFAQADRDLKSAVTENQK